MADGVEVQLQLIESLKEHSLLWSTSTSAPMFFSHSSYFITVSWELVNFNYINVYIYKNFKFPIISTTAHSTDLHMPHLQITIDFYCILVYLQSFSYHKWLVYIEIYFREIFTIRANHFHAKYHILNMILCMMYHMPFTYDIKRYILWATSYCI